MKDWPRTQGWPRTLFPFRQPNGSTVSYEKGSAMPASSGLPTLPWSLFSIRDYISTFAAKWAAIGIIQASVATQQTVITAKEKTIFEFFFQNNTNASCADHGETRGLISSFQAYARHLPTREWDISIWSKWRNQQPVITQKVLLKNK